MKSFAIGCITAAALATAAHAATTTMPAAPTDSWTITNYYKQNVYDPKESKIGTIDDVLVDKAGKVTGLVVGVGGFLGAGEKNVIVPYTAVKSQKKDDKWWLTLDETKDSLKAAPGFKYDRASTTWKPENK
ncbi:PRC-barrel domain-containing protein [Bradyrhizobium sp. CCBAU 53421]|uniref:PRC-barrel domain-containing protein n=1 Tax=Bradyrhizobium sp. CCBAU 53421 TaxID=1325120 RepID=UPI00188C8EBC|nr:PRC-barrel domain-containing protein [Bradyrhizobium sp. CCBAU 53421]QOZ34060.1 PRC-barrel domain containing protein [Bradyrhizobium sp. CCBAU 53421]